MSTAVQQGPVYPFRPEQLRRLAVTPPEAFDCSNLLIAHQVGSKVDPLEADSVRRVPAWFRGCVAADRTSRHGLTALMARVYRLSTARRSYVGEPLSELAVIAGAQRRGLADGALVATDSFGAPWFN